MVDKTGLWLPRLGVLQIENLAVPGIFKLKGDLILWHKTSKRQKIYERQARLAISKRLILGLLAENSQSENRHGPASGAAAPLRRGILRTLRCTPLVFACAKKIYERQARLAISKRLILGLLAENSQSENRHGPASGCCATLRRGILRNRFALFFASKKKSTNGKPGLPSAALAKDGGRYKTRTCDLIRVKDAF